MTEIRPTLNGAIPEVDALVNRDAGLKGGRIKLWNDDGVDRNPVGGATITSNNHALIVKSAIANHVKVRKADDSATLFEVTDTATTVAALTATAATITTLTATTVNTTNLAAVGGAITFFDWTLSLSGNDLLFNDDGATEVIRFGDAGSAFQLKVSGKVNITDTFDHDGATFGVFGKAPAVQQNVGAAATDLATVITLANNIRTALIALGFSV